MTEKVAKILERIGKSADAIVSPSDLKEIKDIFNESKLSWSGSCPHCKSTNFYSVTSYLDNKKVVLSCTCEEHDCGCFWHITYVFDSFKIIEGNKK